MTRGDQRPERNQTDARREGQAIATQNFAGLNTIANPLTIPYEDSPIFTNVYTNDRGGVERRSGTTRLGGDAGRWVQPISTAYGYNFYLTQQGTSLNLAEVSENSDGFNTTRVLQNKVEVFSQRFVNSGGRVSSVVASQPGQQEVFIATGVDAPVILRVVEYRASVTAPGTNPITLPSSPQLRDYAAAQLIMFVDGEEVSISGVANSGTDTIDVTTSPAIPAGDVVVDCFAVSWHWAAEALYYFGDRFFDSRTRFNSSDADRLVEIPANLRDGAFYDPDNSPFFGRSTLPLFVAAADGGSPQRLASLYTQVSNSAPSTATEWAGSTGTLNVAAGVPIPFGSSFVQFGALTGGGASEVIAMTRIRAVPFNGNQTDLTQKSSFVVKVGETVGTNRLAAHPVASASYGDYTTFKADGNDTTAGTDGVAYIHFFQSAQPDGLAPNEPVRLIYTEPVFNGTAATSSADQTTDGSYIPFYGLGQYANYGAFSFPGVVAFYQNRVVFAACPADPLRVFASSISDSNVPGEFYKFFQQDAFTTLDTDPFDVLLTTGYADDRVTAMREYQGSLFVGTQTGLYRLAASDRGAVTAANALVNTEARDEVYNQECLKVVDDKLFVYNSTGIYSVQNNSNLGGVSYELVSITEKVHDIFNNQPKETARLHAWMGYDEVLDAIYVGVCSERSTQIATRLLRLGMFRASWSEYTMPMGYNTSIGVTLKRADNRKVFCASAREFTNVTVGSDGTFNYTLSADTDLLDLNYEALHLDRVTRSVSTGSVALNQESWTPTIQYTIDTDIRLYRIPWDTHPVSDVDDLLVEINGEAQEYLVGYRKKNDSVYLLRGQPGDTLDITYKNPDSDRYLNELYYDQVRETDEVPNLPLSVSPSVGAVVAYGSTYQSLYSTPLFTWGSLGQLKRLIYWVGLFSNEKFQRRWVLEDYNALTTENDRSEVLDRYEYTVDANISFVYDSDDKLADNASDLYNLSEQFYDISSYDTERPLQYDNEVSVRQSLQGIGYSFRAIIWSSNTDVFELLAYQIEAKAKGSKSRHWGGG